MKVVEQTPRKAPAAKEPAQPIPQRHQVRAEAVVYGATNAHERILIRDVSRRGMFLQYLEGSQTAKVPWLRVGAQVEIRFAVRHGGDRVVIRAQAQVRRRKDDGVGVSLVAPSELVVAGLRSLVMAGMQHRDAPAAPVQAPEERHSDKAIKLLEAELPARIGRLAKCYVSNVETALANAKYQAPLGEQRKFIDISRVVEREAAQLVLSAQHQVCQAALDWLHASKSKVEPSEARTNGGLSLVESMDLSASMTAVDAADRIALQLASAWSTLALRLKKLNDANFESCPLAPTTLCLNLRDALYHDPRAPGLRRFDLSVGLNEEFVTELEMFYQHLDALLQRAGG